MEKITITIQVETYQEASTAEELQGSYTASVSTKDSFTGGQFTAATLAMVQSLAEQSNTTVPFILSLLHDMNEETREANNAFKDLGLN